MAFADSLLWICWLSGTEGPSATWRGACHEHALLAQPIVTVRFCVLLSTAADDGAPPEKSYRRILQVESEIGSLWRLATFLLSPDPRRTDGSRLSVM